MNTLKIDDSILQYKQKNLFFSEKRGTRDEIPLNMK